MDIPSPKETEPRPILARDIDGTPISLDKPNQPTKSVWDRPGEPDHKESVPLEFTTQPQLGMAFEIKGQGFYVTAEPRSPEYKKKYPGDVFLERISEEEYQEKDKDSKIESRFLPIPYSVKTSLGLT